MNQRLLIALAIAAALAACSGGKSGKGDDGSQPIPTDTNATPQPTSVVETERIDQGDAMVQARNRNAAGFQTDMASRTVTVTQPCFATADPARLDMLPPTPDEASRRDTSLIQELNTGTVFILRRATRAWSREQRRPSCSSASREVRYGSGGRTWHPRHAKAKGIKKHHLGRG